MSFGRGSRLARGGDIHEGFYPPHDLSRIWFDRDEGVFKYYNEIEEKWLIIGTSLGDGGNIGFTPLNRDGDTLRGNLVVADGVAILPENNEGSAIGSPEKNFADIYIGKNSLFIDNNKVLSSVATTLDVSTSHNQHLAVSTSGLGTTRIASGKEIILHAGEIVNIQSHGDYNALSKGRITFKTDLDGQDILFETQANLSNINFKSKKEVNFDSPNVNFTNRPKVNGVNVLLHGEVSGGGSGGSNQASDIQILDSDNHFTSTNVEEVLAELFTYASDIKSRIANATGSPLLPSDTSSEMENKIKQLKLLLATAITNKGVNTLPTDNLSAMAANISNITNQSLGGFLTNTKLNITAPYIKSITLNASLPIEEIAVSVLEYIGADSGIVHYQADYNNGEISSFNFNNKYVVFDGLMKLKEDYSLIMTHVQTLANGKIFECELDLSEYQDIGKLQADETNTLVYKATPQPQVVKANGDILISGVDKLDQINWIANNTNNGLIKLAISFDSGITYHSWNGSEWILVDINNTDNFRNNGMTTSTVSTLNNSQLSILRGDSNFIRFAYILDRPLLTDNVNTDRIRLFVTMLGYNAIANTNKYSYTYDPLTKTLLFNFNSSGTYTFNYVDG